MLSAHKKFNLKMKYKPRGNRFGGYNLKKGTLFGGYIANGTTHYELYKWSVESGEPICILEHDARVISFIPDSVAGSVIQITSNSKKQLNNIKTERKVRYPG